MMQFTINQSFIARVLCENRDKPEKHCNGKCQLKKELEKDTRQEKNNNRGKDSYEVMFVEVLPSFYTVPPADQLTCTAFYKDLFIQTPLFPIFHPPQLPTVG
ncbi:hypothetical protein [Chitinophaga nivalis]|uniref:Uncharacterized protein n=1 Tax=Chitinophaga nivalis TaxID=2991709 RepID=A0ABT3ISU2_9BACT|nr:hypothetical protein [Chitinophaga nivalis]MCW3463315.1 hypothetical protein [Chitinophaga nivalis]MCW3486995.1 hypothetical protein [Chitinophaga nivalis]